MGLLLTANKWGQHFTGSVKIFLQLVMTTIAVFVGIRY